MAQQNVLLNQITFCTKPKFSTIKLSENRFFFGVTRHILSKTYREFIHKKIFIIYSKLFYRLQGPFRNKTLLPMNNSIIIFQSHFQELSSLLCLLSTKCEYLEVVEAISGKCTGCEIFDMKFTVVRYRGAKSLFFFTNLALFWPTDKKSEWSTTQ